jgi:hypothetical protein
MKKTFTLLLIAFIFFSPAIKAQVFFLETFDNISGPTAGGAGTYTFPSGWLLANVDNKAPDAAVSYVNAAWTRREDFKFNVADSAAFSTSWYSPAAQADDWMWTPAINIAASGSTKLNWNAVAYDPSFPDGYEVRIMTVAPTGSTGNLGNMISASTQLFTIAAENSSWTSRSVDISAYNGNTVYIGFRNHSSDKFVLLIDDIKLEKIPNYDAETIAVDTLEYAQRPFNQSSSVNLKGTIKNSGVQNITNVTLKADIYNSVNDIVYSASGVATGSLTPGSDMSFTIPAWSPGGTGTYTVKYYPVLTETDIKTINDTVTRKIIVTDSIFARDNGVIHSSLGIGAGEGGYIGQAFTITSPVYLTSVTTNYAWGYSGEPYAAVIWNTTAAGAPNTIIASTDTLLYPDDNALLTTVPIHGGKISLTPGTYVVTAIEFDSTLALSNTDSIFTPGTEWVYWPANGFSNVEDFGSTYEFPFYLRLNVSTAAELPLRLISFTGVSSSLGNKLSWKVGEQSGIQQYDIERSSDGIHFISIGSVKANTQSASNYQFNDALPATAINFYRLKIIENLRSSYSHVIRLANAGKNVITLSPNPAKNKVLLQSNNAMLLNTKAKLSNLEGEVLRQMQITQLPFSIDVSTLSKGIYLLQLEDNSVLKIIKQ